MSTALVILILIVSVLLGLVVLVQNSKGGGLISNFGSANQMMGVRQTTDFLEKATWTMAIVLVVLCLISSATVSSNSSSSTNRSEDYQERLQDFNGQNQEPQAQDPQTTEFPQ